jgi:hypothetical protein
VCQGSAFREAVDEVADAALAVFEEHELVPLRDPLRASAARLHRVHGPSATSVIEMRQPESAGQTSNARGDAEQSLRPSVNRGGS